MIYARYPLDISEDMELTASMEVRAQRGILRDQQECLRRSQDGIGNRAAPRWWRAAIVETEQRLADAEADLARAKAAMGDG